MPRYEDDSRRRRRPSSSASAEAETGVSRAKGHRGSASDKVGRRSHERRGRDRSTSQRRSEKYSQDRRENRSHRDRGRSGSPHDDSRRRHRRRSRERRSRNDDDDEPSAQRSHHHRSPPARRSPSPRPQRSKGPLPSQQDAFSKTPGELSETTTPAPEKIKPNFANTGQLAAEANTVSTADGNVVLKYHEPPEARKPPPKEAWRLYIFKDEDLLETLELSGRTCWLIGRERLVADLPVDHPSCSKQHAALQFRYIEKRNEFGDRKGRVRPYLIDLESANGSTVNGDPAPPGRYMELMDKDVLKFGHSTREYVLMLPPQD